MAQFRLQSKNFFLTFPQADFELQGFVDLHKELCTYVLVSSETHADGNLHRHALLIFENRKSIRNANHFDYLDFHPNVQVPRNIVATKTYIKKDGTFIEWMKDAEDIFQLAETLSTKDFLKYCVKHKIQYSYYQEILRLVKTDINTIIEYEIPPEVNLPLALAALTFEDTKTYVLIGPTGIGKTVCAKAKAVKPILFVRHIDVLKQFRPEYHNTIIFDDMGFTHMPREAQIHLVDRHDCSTIHIRYGTVSIPPNTRKIFTANRYPFEEDAAIRRRLTLIDLF